MNNYQTASLPACPYYADKCSENKLRCYGKDFVQCHDFKDITDAKRRERLTEKNNLLNAVKQVKNGWRDYRGREDLSIWEDIDWSKVSEDNR